MTWLKTLAFTVLYPGTVCVGIPLAILWRDWGSLRPTGPWAIAGGAVAALGLAGYAVCASEFVRRGHGTPAPYDPPKDLVVSGFYRFSRNPMYVSVWSIVAGETIATRSAGMLIYAAILALGFHLRVLLYEEPELHRLFGESYERYRAEVPRWLGRK